MVVIGEGMFIIDTPYCSHRAQELREKDLNTVYTRFNFVGQVGAGKKNSRK